MTRGKAALLIGLVMLSSCLAGCRSNEASSALLRHSPEVGDTCMYSAELVGYAQVAGEMTVLSEEDGWRQIAFSGALFGEPHAVTMAISDRHNPDRPGYISLNFPDEPVSIGDTWQGEVPWYFEHYFVLDETPITVPASYELLDIKQGKKGKYAVIEQTVDVDTVVENMVFHIGQLGVRWDEEGRVTDVYEGYDAYGKLMVGDVVIGINGQDATSQQDRNLLAERCIQHPKESSIVTLTVLRDGRESTIDVEKSIDELAIVKVENLKELILVNFDIDRGLLLSAEDSISEDIRFSSPTGDAFPIVDSYGGYSKFGYLEGSTVYEESYGGSGVAWRLKLDE